MYENIDFIQRNKLTPKNSKFNYSKKITPKEEDLDSVESACIRFTCIKLDPSFVQVIFLRHDGLEQRWQCGEVKSSHHNRDAR